MRVDTISVVIKVSFVFFWHVLGKCGFGFVVNHAEVKQLSIKRKTRKHDI